VNRSLYGIFLYASFVTKIGLNSLLLFNIKGKPTYVWKRGSLTRRGSPSKRVLLKRRGTRTGVRFVQSPSKNQVAKVLHTLVFEVKFFLNSQSSSLKNGFVGVLLEDVQTYASTQLFIFRYFCFDRRLKESLGYFVGQQCFK